MTTSKGGAANPAGDELRRLAEHRHCEGRGASAGCAEGLHPEAQRRVHELEVYQIELELQGEELRRTQAEMEQLLAHYTDLYELAPVGYLTVSRGGAITQVNRAGARMVGLERSRLVDHRLGPFLSPESRSGFDSFLARVFRSLSTETCEIEVRSDGAAARRLDLAGTVSEGALQCRVVATDVTERRRAEEKVRSQLEELRRWQGVMQGREERMQALKREVNDLCRRLGEPTRYASQDPARAP